MSGESSENRDSHGFLNTRSIWRGVSLLAATRDGVLSADELRSVGLTLDAIEYRCRAGFLHPLLRGVYAVGHRSVSRRGQLRAATLWAPGSALSHGSAAELATLQKLARGPIHLTSSQQVHHRRGIRGHRRTLPPDELTLIADIPTTTIARTLLDLAATEGERSLRRALREAHFHHRGRPQDDLLALAERYPGARGTGVVRSVLTRGTWARRIRSPLEDEFLEFCADRRIPLPKTNTRIAAGARSYEADCVWLQERLIVELDGRGSHEGDRGFEEDRERDGALLAAGWSSYRLTGRRLHGAPTTVERELRALLARPSA